MTKFAAKILATATVAVFASASFDNKKRIDTILFVLFPRKQGK